MKPPGLTLIHDYISAATERDLLTPISTALSLSKEKGSGTDRSRIIRLGWGYDRPHKWLGDIPAWLTQPIPNSALFNSMTLNEYLPGRGIRPHIDSLDFGDQIVILSLGASAAMRFSKAGQEDYDLELPSRSMLILQDKARYDFQHSVLPIAGKEIRYSIVFRSYTP